MTSGQRTLDRERVARRDQRLAAQDPSQRKDRLLRQVREVDQRLLLDLAVRADRNAATASYRTREPRPA